jgi:hypothetical protein
MTGTSIVAVTRQLFLRAQRMNPTGAARQVRDADRSAVFPAKEPCRGI